MSALRAIDCDGHVTEVAIDWAKRMPSEFQDRLPTPAQDANGQPQIVLDGLAFPSPTYEGKGRWMTGAVPVSAHPAGMHDPLARLPDMDAEDIEIAVLFGTTINFHGASTDDWRYSEAVLRAYNDWIAEYCSANPERLKFVALLPAGNPEAAAREAERAVRQLGAVGLAMPVNYGGRALDHRSFDPVYAAAQQLDVPICVHGGTGSMRWIQTVGAHENWLITHALAFPMGLIHALGAVVMGGVLDRFPTLRIGFLEGGCGWLPFFMDRFDEHVEKIPGLVPGLQKLPSEYIKGGRLFISCEPEEDLAYPISKLGEDVIMYASDYAHWDCEFPNSVRAIAERDELTDTQKRKILRDNALSCYRLAVPAIV